MTLFSSCARVPLATKCPEYFPKDCRPLKFAHEKFEMAQRNHFIQISIGTAQFENAHMEVYSDSFGHHRCSPGMGLFFLDFLTLRRGSIKGICAHLRVQVLPILRP